MDNDDITVRVLRDIRDEIQGLRGEVREMKGEIVDMKGEIVDMKGEIVDMKGEIVEMKGEIVDMKGEIVDMKGEIRSTNRRIDVLTEATRRGFDSVNERIDGVIRIVGTHHGDLDARVTRIEEHLSLR